ncbi:hypothetical protein D9757_006916 [Collybiopsis confluens]|uniref:Laccase n=1 Tax=Collybiopsis confluens TaxID=2823264 RepID=A0A8H5HIA6_9AGAR|nr:hypothetical protein D9757_006916 [Collybiopsis confluens]
MTKGLRGALVVYDPEDPLKDLYDVDDVNTIWQVGDCLPSFEGWLEQRPRWHNTTIPLLAGYVATGIVPVSDSGTFNGIGRFQGGPEVPFHVVNVVQGKRYRFRIINTSARNVFTISVDSHNLTIIETDGNPTSPMTVNSIDMLAGQRYSVVVAANQPVDNYWINAPFVGGDPSRNLNQNATLSRAILRYQGAPAADPAAPMSLGPAGAELNALVEANLRPLVAAAAPEPDINITLNLVVIPPADSIFQTAGKAQWNVNNVSYLAPHTPTLVKILEGANSANDFNVTENTFILPANKIVQVIFPPSIDDEAHPFHLHANNFWLIKSNSSEEINTANPIKRDVAGVGSTGTIMRFSTANPGPWFFHCHIFWHFFAGLATVMASGLDDIRKEVHPTLQWDLECPLYDILPTDLQ